MIKRDADEPIYQQIQKLLIENIRSGEYPPGALLPSEPAMAKNLGVSRVTVRKALDGLAARNIVYRHQGRGTYVSDHVMRFGLSTLLSFSRSLEERGHDVETRVLKQGKRELDARLANRLGLESGDMAIEVRRLRLVDERPVAIHTSYFNQQTYAALEAMDLANVSLGEAMQAAHPDPLVEAEDTVSADLPSADEAELLQVEKSTPVLRVEGIAFNGRRRPIRFTEAVYPGDAFTFVVLNSVSGRAGTAVGAFLNGPTTRSDDGVRKPSGSA